MGQRTRVIFRLRHQLCDDQPELGQMIAQGADNLCALAHQSTRRSRARKTIAAAWTASLLICATSSPSSTVGSDGVDALATASIYQGGR